MEIDPHELKKITESQTFKAICERVRSSLTRRVMSANTSDEERANCLAEYRALERLLAALETAKAP